MLDVIMISQGQGLACRKQHGVVSDAVELKVKGRIEILDIKKNYFYLSPHAVVTIMVLLYFFIVFLLKICNNYSNFLWVRKFIYISDFYQQYGWLLQTSKGSLFETVSSHFILKLCLRRLYCDCQKMDSNILRQI